MRDLNRIRIEKTKLYTQISFDLSVARNQEELVIAGRFLKYFESTNISDSIQFKFNEFSMDNIIFKKGGFVRLPFYRIYITNAAIAGATATIIISEHDDFDCENSIDVNLSGSISSIISNFPTDYPDLNQDFNWLNGNDVTVPKLFSISGATISPTGLTICIHPYNANFNNRYLCIEDVTFYMRNYDAGFANPLYATLYQTNNSNTSAWSSMNFSNRKNYSTAQAGIAGRYNSGLLNNGAMISPLFSFSVDTSGVQKNIRHVVNQAVLSNYVNNTNYNGYTIHIQHNNATINLYGDVIIRTRVI